MSEPFRFRISDDDGPSDGPGDNNSSNGGGGGGGSNTSGNNVGNSGSTGSDGGGSSSFGGGGESASMHGSETFNARDTNDQQSGLNRDSPLPHWDYGEHGGDFDPSNDKPGGGGAGSQQGESHSTAGSGREGKGTGSFGVGIGYGQLAAVGIGAGMDITESVSGDDSGSAKISGSTDVYGVVGPIIAVPLPVKAPQLTIWYMGAPVPDYNSVSPVDCSAMAMLATPLFSIQVIKDQGFSMSIGLSLQIGIAAGYYCGFGVR